MAEIDLDLDDMVLLVSVLPKEAKDHCLNAYDEARKAQEAGDVRLFETMKTYIKNWLVLHKIIEE